MIIAYDLTEEILAIAPRLGRNGRLKASYSSPAWSVELTSSGGDTYEGRGPTCAQAIVALGKELRK